MGEPRSGEDAESVGAPATQRNVVRGQARLVTERSDRASLADATRRGAVDIANHAALGAGRARAQRGSSTARAKRGGSGIA